MASLPMHSIAHNKKPQTPKSLELGRFLFHQHMCIVTLYKLHGIVVVKYLSQNGSNTAYSTELHVSKLPPRSTRSTLLLLDSSILCI